MKKVPSCNCLASQFKSPNNIYLDNSYCEIPLKYNPKGKAIRRYGRCKLNFCPECGAKFIETDELR